MWRLAASFTSTAELEVRLLELGALDGRLVDLVAAVGERQCVVPVPPLCLDDLSRPLQLQGVRGTDAHTELATRAVQRSHLHSVVIVVQDTSADGRAAALPEGGRGCVQLLLRQKERADGGVRADEAALVALRASVHVNPGHVDGDAALLVLARPERHAPPGLEGAHWQVVAVQVVARLLNLASESRGRCRGRRACFLALEHRSRRSVAVVGLQVRPSRRHLTLDDACEACVDAVDVHLHNLVTLLSVHLLDAALEQLQGGLVRHDATQLEEDALHDHVDALAQARLHRDLRCVDNVDPGAPLGQIPPHSRWEPVRELLLRPRAVDDANSAGLEVASHVILLHIALLVDGEVISGAHVVWSADWPRAEAQVADGHPAALFGVVLEVGLRIQVGVERNQLHRTLVGAYSAVAAQPIEHALCGPLGQHIKPITDWQ
mmetsp:Transcript_65587/g.170312  ORF Transcript_65587/g.170312 Transcript_65587/m.170312 type:complete len:434 (-) Transcript_65587:154-1455(-)